MCKPPRILESDRQVESTHEQIIVFTQVKRRDIIRMVVTDFGTNHHVIVELMADPDRVARIIGRKARPLAAESSHHSLRTVK